ncbi:MAG: hypothetical protein HYS21_13060 [Deltaproteobacteria bacterium]|nr:hypothetical protein [Deltaproteobacteria bacterium]
MKYYLVALFDADSDSQEQFCWMTYNGEKWVNALNGNWKPKHKKDIIAEIVEVEHITELDWSKTPLYNDELISGWLSRDGRFYGCPSKYHDTLAACVLGLKVPELENMGWVRVYDHNWFTCQHRLSAEQRNWLSQNGHRVTDSH